MRHLKRTAKLGRTGQHRNRMLASLVCSLIKHRRVTTTLAKAKAARSVAEKMITLGKGGTLHQRRLASARLHQDEDAIKILFNEIAPTQKERHGGYTRIVKTKERKGDNALMAIIELVGFDGADAERKRRKQKKQAADLAAAAGKTVRAPDATESQEKTAG